MLFKNHLRASSELSGTFLGNGSERYINPKKQKQKQKSMKDTYLYGINTVV